MKIIVFVKQIPDTNDVKLDPKTGNLRRDGVKSRINPNDLNVIETAMELKRAHGAQVCAFSSSERIRIRASVRFAASARHAAPLSSA